MDFGSTAAHADVSDFWEETLSEDGLSYLVDGEWRPLIIKDYEIKVAFESEPRKY
jgi:acyl-homoserine lactone acylase PvdQ